MTTPYPHAVMYVIIGKLKPSIHIWVKSSPNGMVKMSVRVGSDWYSDAVCNTYVVQLSMVSVVDWAMAEPVTGTVPPPTLDRLTVSVCIDTQRAMGGSQNERIGQEN